jgi:uncharacterized protein (DUF433 family)
MPHTARMEVNPKVMLGKPVIRGTRIPVELILRKLGEGLTAADTVAHEEAVSVAPRKVRAGR